MTQTWMGAEPFDPQKDKPIQNADGSITTELTVTIQDQDGNWVNVPSVWWKDGKPVHLSEDFLYNGFMKNYETSTGRKFPRYKSLDEAEKAATERSKEGGGTKGVITGYADGGVVSHSILDLSPEDFNFALKEMGLPEQEALDLMKQYRDKNSVFPKAPDWLQSDPNSNTSSYFPVKVPKGKSIIEGVKEGTWDWAVPEALTASSVKPITDAVETPANLLKGVPYTDQEVQQNAMVAAGLAGTGGFATSAASEIPQDAMGIFAGIRSRNADIMSLERAEKMAEMGQHTPQEIFRATGWFQGLDGEWKWEIPDDKANYSSATDWMAPGRNNYQGDFFIEDTHPELFGAYKDHPQVTNNDVVLDWVPDKTGGHYRAPWYDKGEVYAKGADHEDFKSVLTHEFQHAVQAAEDWAGKGYNPEAVYNSIAAVVGNFPPKVVDFAKTVSGIRGRAKAIKDTEIELDQISNSTTPKGWETTSDYLSPEEIDDWKNVTLPSMKNDLEKELQKAAKQAKIIGQPFAEKIVNLFEITDGWSLHNTPYLAEANKNRAYNTYKNNIGEVEARAAQKRKDLSPTERYARHPSLDYDPPEGGRYWDNNEFNSLLKGLEEETKKYLQSINTHDEVR